MRNMEKELLKLAADCEQIVPYLRWQAEAFEKLKKEIEAQGYLVIHYINHGTYGLLKNDGGGRQSENDKCFTCGGDFLPSVVIDGKHFHRGCAAMSYGPHTHHHFAEMMSKLWKIWDASAKFEADPSEENRVCLKKALVATYGREVYEANLGVAQSGQSA